MLDDGLTLAEGDNEGLTDEEGLVLALGETEALGETLGEIDEEGDKEADPAEGLGDVEAEGERLGLTELEGLVLAEGLRLALGLTLGEILEEGERLEEFRNDTKESLVRIEQQTTKTNGRVDSLEKSRTQLWSTITILVMVASSIVGLLMYALDARIDKAVRGVLSEYSIEIKE